MNKTKVFELVLNSKALNWEVLQHETINQKGFQNGAFNKKNPNISAYWGEEHFIRSSNKILKELSKSYTDKISVRFKDIEVITFSYEVFDNENSSNYYRQILNANLFCSQKDYERILRLFMSLSKEQIINFNDLF